jgi:hypothetical protein
MTTAIVEEARFQWGVVIAGAVAAAATSFFLVTLGTGIGLALAPSHPTTGKAVTFLTLGAVYFFAAQAFGFAVGGYLVGRLIGPEPEENRKEEEFRAAAHGFVMWAAAIIAGLLLLAVSSGMIGPMANAPNSNSDDGSGYFVDMLFHGAPTSAQLEADKVAAGPILAMAAIGTADASDTTRLAQMVSQDVRLSESASLQRVADVEARTKVAADQARKAASMLSLWTALSLLFGSVVTVASAISARWMDDRISFSMARRY